MSDYLLVGTRIPGATELSPDVVARDVIASCAWHRVLLRWGLLRAFALGGRTLAEPTVCLVVQVSGAAAAEVLAVGWQRAVGYRVTALPLIEPGAVDERLSRWVTEAS